MKTIRRWIWAFLGYDCCLPVHQHQLSKLFENYQKNMHEMIGTQLAQQRAQIFEFLKQQEGEKRPIEVRLVK